MGGQSSAALAGSPTSHRLPGRSRRRPDTKGQIVLGVNGRPRCAAGHHQNGLGCRLHGGIVGEVRRPRCDRKVGPVSGTQRSCGGIRHLRLVRRVSNPIEAYPDSASIGHEAVPWATMEPIGEYLHGAHDLDRILLKRVADLQG
eukprot:4325-Prymnesium_polylepis.2